MEIEQVVDLRPFGPQLITYIDRLAGDLNGLTSFLNDQIPNTFDGVHLLPYFTPFDGVDAGFDPTDHTQIDPRLGTWADVKELSNSHVIMSDVIVNHMSKNSPQFQDFLKNGAQSKFASLFLTLSSIYPHGVSEADLAGIYRPRPGFPFTLMTVGSAPRLIWTTFTSEQVDIDLRTEEAWIYLTGVIDTLTNAGVTVLRLDAVGYTGKEAGTNCFMTASTQTYTQRIVDIAHARGAQVLLEIHGHYTQQITAAEQVDYVYDFALPPLVLHALHRHDLGPLERWFAIRPANSFTVLDTHDGIGIIDVGESDLLPGAAGLLSAQDIDQLVESIHDASGGGSRVATGSAASNLDLYQVNCTFYDALGSNDARYLIARMIQLMTPGVPQIYYAGLFAAPNDMDLLRSTGVGRDINRPYFDSARLTAALSRPVVQMQLAAIRLRTSHEAFLGEFTFSFTGSNGTMQWQHGNDRVHLSFDAALLTFKLEATGGSFVTLTEEDLLHAGAN